MIRAVNNNRRKRNTRARTNIRTIDVRKRGVGTEQIPPHVIGSQQPQSTIITKERIETRKFTLAYDILTGSAGNMCFYIGTSIPGVVANSTGTGLLSDLLTADEPQIPSFGLYRVRKVEVILTPLRPITDAPITMYAAYDPIQRPVTITSPFLISEATRYANSIRLSSREASSFTYRVKNPSSLAYSSALSILQGGWIDALALATAPVSLIANMGPGYILLTGLTSLLGQGIMRLEVAYEMQFKLRKNV